MKLAKVLIAITGIAFVGVSQPSRADEPKTSTTSKEIKTVEDLKKPRRKKKVEMCAECGKPESECDCPGYEHKKGKSSDKKDEHEGH